MRMELKGSQVWIANEAVDFRKAANGLMEIVESNFHQGLGDGVYVFYNRDKTKLKVLAQHRNGVVLIYKRLDKNRFTLKPQKSAMYEVTEQQLAWLLAGLDWVSMSEWKELSYQDYY